MGTYVRTRVERRDNDARGSTAIVGIRQRLENALVTRDAARTAFGPWVPEESPGPDHDRGGNVIPLVLSEWRAVASLDRPEQLEMFPAPWSNPRRLISIVDEERQSVDRVRRFAAAWEWLESRTRNHVARPLLLPKCECDQHLAGAGVMLKVSRSHRADGASPRSGHSGEGTVDARCDGTLATVSEP